MKKISSFIQLWVIWFVLAFIEADDPGEYRSNITMIFITSGLLSLTISLIIIPIVFGWSWFSLMLGVIVYLLTGIAYNEWMRSEFGYRVFP